jgi:hypothetical protein
MHLMLGSGCFKELKTLVLRGGVRNCKGIKMLWEFQVIVSPRLDSFSEVQEVSKLEH